MTAHSDALMVLILLCRKLVEIGFSWYSAELVGWVFYEEQLLIKFSVIDQHPLHVL